MPTNDHLVLPYFRKAGRIHRYLVMVVNVTVTMLICLVISPDSCLKPLLYCVLMKSTYVLIKL